MPAIWALAGGVSTGEVDDFRAGRVEQRGFNRTAGENHPKRVAIGLHLQPVRSRKRIRTFRHLASGLEIDEADSILFDQ